MTLTVNFGVSPNKTSLVLKNLKYNSVKKFVYEIVTYLCPYINYRYDIVMKITFNKSIRKTYKYKHITIQEFWRNIKNNIKEFLLEDKENLHHYYFIKNNVRCLKPNLVFFNFIKIEKYQHENV